MPHVTLVFPAIGSHSRTRRGRSWQMQPLAIASLAAQTPANWDRTFYDDRQESIEFDRPTDLAAISVETFTARRAYQIAAEYRRLGVPVAMGGYHATICPTEVKEHADAVCVGESEGVWPRMLEDTRHGKMKGLYHSAPGDPPAAMRYDRSIFKGKHYFRMALVESGRGCRFHCAFCSVAAFHRSHYKVRPVADVVAEIRASQERLIFIVDDNVVADPHHARELFAAMAGLGKPWVGQASVNLGHDLDLMDRLAESGCAALLLGFESLSREALASLDKTVNLKHDYQTVIAELRKRGIAVYGTFMLGLPSDTAETPQAVSDFTVQQRLFLASFNHVVPFPGTPLYARIESEGRLSRPTWWLDDADRFSELPFTPWSASADQVRDWCRQARRDAYGWYAILRRATDFRANCRTPRKALLFLAMNLLLHREFYSRKAFPLGVRMAQGGKAS